MNDSIMVDLPDQRSYPIHISANCLSDRDLWVKLLPNQQIAVITNETVAKLYLDQLVQGLARNADVITIGDGEEFKSLDSFIHVTNQLVRQKHNRTTTIIAFGGGVVGDLAGFVAATYQRGVRYIQVPTTLLAQVDSAVGGKTAINHKGGKNLIGAFYQPHAVVVDLQTLQSLPQSIFVEGIAEVIKYGVIADPNFFEWLEENRDHVLAQDAGAMRFLVRRCCEIKADIVTKDERESGLRAILNYGHTFGHAIESISGYGSYLHGEAVAIGMVLAADTSVRMGLCPPEIAARIRAILSAYGLETTIPQLDAEKMLEAMAMDKKVMDGTLRFILLRALGKVEIRDDVSTETLLQSLAQST